MASPGIPSRIADLNKLANDQDAKLLINVITEALFTIQSIATKLDAEASLGNKSYSSGITLKK